MLIDFMLDNISKRVKSFPPTGLGKRYGIDETAAVCPAVIKASACFASSTDRFQPKCLACSTNFWSTTSAALDCEYVFLYMLITDVGFCEFDFSSVLLT